MGGHVPAGPGEPAASVLEPPMPRWMFFLFSFALALAVIGSLLIVLRSPNSLPPITNQPRSTAP